MDFLNVVQNFGQNDHLTLRLITCFKPTITSLNVIFQRLSNGGRVEVMLH